LGIQLERKVGKVRNWSLILPQGLGQASRLCYRHSGEGRDSSKHHCRTASSFCPACWIPVCAGMTRGSLPTPSFPCIR